MRELKGHVHKVEQPSETTDIFDILHTIASNSKSTKVLLTDVLSYMTTPPKVSKPSDINKPLVKYSPKTIVESKFNTTKLGRKKPKNGFLQIESLLKIMAISLNDIAILISNATDQVIPKHNNKIEGFVPNSNIPKLIEGKKYKDEDISELSQPTIPKSLLDENLKTSKKKLSKKNIKNQTIGVTVDNAFNPVVNNSGFENSLKAINGSISSIKKPSKVENVDNRGIKNHLKTINESITNTEYPTVDNSGIEMVLNSIQATVTEINLKMDKQKGLSLNIHKPDDVNIKESKGYINFLKKGNILNLIGEIKSILSEINRKTPNIPQHRYKRIKTTQTITETVSKPSKKNSGGAGNWGLLFKKMDNISKLLIMIKNDKKVGHSVYKDMSQLIDKLANVKKYKKAKKFLDVLNTTINSVSDAMVRMAESINSGVMALKDLRNQLLIYMFLMTDPMFEFAVNRLRMLIDLNNKRVEKKKNNSMVALTILSISALVASLSLLNKINMSQLWQISIWIVGIYASLMLLNRVINIKSPISVSSNLAHTSVVVALFTVSIIALMVALSYFGQLNWPSVLMLVAFMLSLSFILGGGIGRGSINRSVRGSNNVNTRIKTRTLGDSVLSFALGLAVLIGIIALLQLAGPVFWKTAFLFIGFIALVSIAMSGPDIVMGILYKKSGFRQTKNSFFTSTLAFSAGLLVILLAVALSKYVNFAPGFLLIGFVALFGFMMGLIFGGGGDVPGGNGIGKFLGNVKKTSGISPARFLFASAVFALSLFMITGALAYTFSKLNLGTGMVVKSALEFAATVFVLISIINYIVTGELPFGITIKGYSGLTDFGDNIDYKKVFANLAIIVSIFAIFAAMTYALKSLPGISTAYDPLLAILSTCMVMVMVSEIINSVNGLKFGKMLENVGKMVIITALISLIVVGLTYIPGFSDISNQLLAIGATAVEIIAISWLISFAMSKVSLKDVAIGIVSMAVVGFIMIQIGKGLEKIQNINFKKSQIGMASLGLAIVEMLIACIAIGFIIAIPIVAGLALAGGVTLTAIMLLMKLAASTMMDISKVKINKANVDNFIGNIKEMMKGVKSLGIDKSALKSSKNMKSIINDLFESSKKINFISGLKYDPNKITDITASSKNMMGILSGIKIPNEKIGKSIDKRYRQMASVLTSKDMKELFWDSVRTETLIMNLNKFNSYIDGTYMKFKGKKVSMKDNPLVSYVDTLSKMKWLKVNGGLMLLNRNMDKFVKTVNGMDLKKAIEIKNMLQELKEFKLSNKQVENWNKIFDTLDKYSQNAVSMEKTLTKVGENSGKTAEELSETNKTMIDNMKKAKTTGEKLDQLTIQIMGMLDDLKSNTFKTSIESCDTTIIVQESKNLPLRG